MLLLSANQVRYCQVTKPVQEGKVEVVPGIVYHGKVFVRGEIFPLTQKKRAIEYSRQRFTDYKEKVYILIIEEGDRLTLWYESSEAKRLAPHQNQYFSDFISTIDLNQLVFKMRGENGVPMKMRRRGFRTFRNCFSGREGLNWLQQHLKISRNDAIRVGQRLIKENWLCSPTHNTNSFQDGDVLYRFYLDE